VGRVANVVNERNILFRAAALSSKYVRPVFLNGDLVVIRWIFDFEWLDGTVTHVEEIAYQSWDDRR
jgi:hypothetical protein